MCILDDHKSHNTISLYKYTSLLKTELIKCTEKIVQGKNILTKKKEDVRCKKQKKEQEVVVLKEKLRALEEELRKDEGVMNELEDRIQKATTSSSILEKSVERMGFNELVLIENVEAMKRRVNVVFFELFSEEEREIRKNEAK